MVSDKLYAKVSKEVVDRMNVVVRSVNLGVISRKEAGRGTVKYPEAEDLAVIIYTSGTMSSPKGVMLSHGNLCNQLDQVSRL